MHFLIMLKPILSNWAAEREERREVTNTSQRDGFPPCSAHPAAIHSTHSTAVSLLRRGEGKEINEVLAEERHEHSVVPGVVW